MTNFAFLMDLLEISAKEFSKTGFDHTLVSRWRAGKRRLMPGRRQAAITAKLFMETDAKREFPVLEKLVQIWYPTQPYGMEAEKQELLEMFLTEKGQTEPDYRKKREVRLECLRNYSEAAPAAPQGIEAVRLGLLDFLDLIGGLPEPTQISFVFTEGLAIYLDDSDFGRMITKKLMELFEAGHRMLSVMRSDSAMRDAWYFQKIKLYAHLKGYITTQYYDEYEQQGSEKILGTAGDKLAIKVTRQRLTETNDTRMNIYNDAKKAAEIGAGIKKYISRSRPLAYYGFFDKPDGWLNNISIQKDKPGYLFARMPHFSLATPEELAKYFALTNDEAALVMREFRPIALEPCFFNEDVPVRHVFCETDIEDALMKKRHQSHELSAMLGRKVWMSTKHLAQQLAKIQTLSKTCKNYEVCFLDHAQFNGLLVQIGVWGNEAAISWIENRPALSCKNYLLVSSMQSLCVKAWNEIPAEIRSRRAANRKLDRWEKHLRIS